MICCLWQDGYAQPKSVDFTIGVANPETSDDFSQMQIQKLESKIVLLIDNSNEAIVGYNNDIALCSNVSIEGSEVVSGGMQNMTVTIVDFSFVIKQISTGVVYSTMSEKIKGSGNDYEQSITNAISNLNTIENRCSQFISQGKEKILNYYYANCNSIVQQAVNSGYKKDYEQALSILQSIPASTSCYDDAKKKSIELYVKYQQSLCPKYIMKAKGEIAVNNYSEAFTTLQLIDPESNCFKEANTLIAQISNKIDKREKQEYNLEIQRINAIKAIGVAYYSNKVRSKKIKND